jgi:hypothetical protein
MVGTTATADGTVVLQGSPAAMSAYRSDVMGPLRRFPRNPRYFTADGLKPVYLTGSHTWQNLVDGSRRDPPAAFDFPAYLANLKRWNHNFIRLWAWDVSRDTNRGYAFVNAPQPFVRRGPERALDGKPKFDLTRLNRKYFDRLRSRVLQARRAGIYVSVMLFEGYTADKGPLPAAYRGHPFAAENNINGIDGDVNNDGRVNEVYSLPGQGGMRRIDQVQKAYVRKVIDSVNDLDNVLYEIVNEAPPASTAWQYQLIRYIKSYQAHKPKQHPVGMTFQYKGGTNETLHKSPADWISPNGRIEQPSVASGTKVVLSDTDHLCGVCVEADDDWAWREFTSGRNPIYMDGYGDPWTRAFAASGELARAAMGDTRGYAEQIDLGAMPPHPELASTGYALADPGREYLIYQPDSGAFTLNLNSYAGRTFSVEWFTLSSRPISSETISGGHTVTLRPPHSTAAAAHLRANASYPASGTLILTHDAGKPTRWTDLTLKATLLSHTHISTAARSSNDMTDWSSWRPTLRNVPAGRYVQIRLTLSTTDRERTPILDKVILR